MAFSNYKKMFGGYSLLQNDIVDFFRVWRRMIEINRIKNRHDMTWYNQYLKDSKDFAKIILQNTNIENISSIHKTVFSIYDSEML